LATHLVEEVEHADHVVVLHKGSMRHQGRVADLLDWARQNPGALMLGSTPHLAMEDLLGAQQIQYTHVPFKGTTDQMLALAAGTIMADMNSTGFAP
jgi:tripartite-type tricarboxylate transporter receptor subunit TctC